jgi:predicted enzyme related to lactoylglutathione lyase
MISGIGPIIYPVKDLARAKALYGKLLGVAPYLDARYYVGFRVGELQVGLDPHGHTRGWIGPVTYWNVGDIKANLAALLDAGAEELESIRDVGRGKLIASIKDADGNVTGLIQSP